MSRGGNKRKNAQVRIATLKVKKRNGLLVAAAAFIGLVAFISVKLMLMSYGFEWANSDFANMGIFILAMVAAGVAGWGTRSWNKARNEILAIEGRSKK